MPLKDMLLALVVVLAWGLNFIAIKLGLHGIPPMLLGALRFFFAAVPAVFFIKRPNVPWRWLILYGLTISFGQFALLFSAIYVGMPAGLASLVMQAQAFFTLLFAVLLLNERLRMQHLFGLLIAAAGLAIIGMQGGHTMTIAGFLLTLCAALSWSAGNIVTKKIGKVDMLGLVVWGSLLPPLPFLAMSLWLESPQAIATALSNISMVSILSILYLAFIATLLGYSLWSRLLSRYPASHVAPFSLLVPVIGLSSASLLLGEQLTSAQMLGTVFVMVGLGVNVFGHHIAGRLIARRS
jgi:O-acetylserine/cysteine efflux transporter